MQLKDEKVYEDWKANNTDGYGSGIFRYAEKWANLMEEEMQTGAKIEDIASRLSDAADTEGITGHMYGAAIGVLSNCWIHGEALKAWHEKDRGY